MNAVVGDIDGNAAKIEELAAQARDAGAQLVVFPELALTGYPPEDLLLKRGFLRRAQAALEGLEVERHHGDRRMAGGRGRARVQRGRGRRRRRRSQAVYRKLLLPNYGVFDERRWFEPGDEPARRRRRRHAGRHHRVRGHLGARADRGHRGGRRARRREPVGVALPPRQGDGARADDRAARARQRRDDGLLQPRRRPGRAGLRRPQPDRHARRRGDRARAAVRGGARPRRARSRSRCRRRRRSTARSSPACATTSTKNGFEKVVIASSGGIDSALTVLVAVDALGPERVVTVTMPSRYSSEGTKSDARTLSENLGARAARDPDRGRDGGVRRAARRRRSRAASRT